MIDKAPTSINISLVIGERFDGVAHQLASIIVNITIIQKEVYDRHNMMTSSPCEQSAVASLSSANLQPKCETPERAAIASGNDKTNNLKTKQWRKECST